ncbi:MAG TPA: hypothetical protein VFA00_02955, partial [Actinomycetota bacterium]|nr:hypothetical protein [Actinomycetota bacterium]
RFLRGVLRTTIAGSNNRTAPLQEEAQMADVAYTSRVSVERIRGPQRRAHLPGLSHPITFGVHSEVAEHYGISAEDFPPDATTLDYVVAAAGG